MMADIQTQFNKYHEAIKLNDFYDNKPLRDKRDMLLKELKTYLSKHYRYSDETTPTFNPLNQGSYNMGTGVRPLDGDYDIDVGLRFNVHIDDFEPVDLKQLVQDALSKGNRTVEIKRPCVRVQYVKKGENAYHVDFAVYAYDEDGDTYLAKGYVGSSEENKYWELADPEQLKEEINSRFEDKDERHQFKRVIRYLKRWKDIWFPNTGHGAPTGIALTALAYDHFCPVFYEDTSTPCDIEAFLDLVEVILKQFKKRRGEYIIAAHLPVEPYNDLFEKMSGRQMTNLKSRLEGLKGVLETALDEDDLYEACEVLSEELGYDFPMP